MAQYIVASLWKIEVLKKVKYLVKYKQWEKKIKKALQKLYFSFWWTKRLFQKHNFVKGCRNVMSGYQKEGRTDADLINCFFKSKYFLHRVLNYVFENIKQRNENIFLKQLWLFLLILERRCPLSLRRVLCFK